MLTVYSWGQIWCIICRGDFLKKFVLAIFFVFMMGVDVNAQVFMPWTFEVYDEADFGARDVGRFYAQFVDVLEYGAEDWVRVVTGDGSVGWVNMRHTPDFDELGAFFHRLGRNVSVFYKNLDTGFTYAHNPDRVFFAASFSKMTHAFYSFVMAERGWLDMYEVHTFGGGDMWGGTGIMQFMPFGTQFTTRELLGLSMRESDNAAFRMLVRMQEDAQVSYADFVREIGADTRMIRDIFAQNTHARDAGLWMYEIFNYIEGPSLFGHYLLYDMLNTAPTSHPHFTRWEYSSGIGCNGWGTDVNTVMIRSDYPLARKYGWANGAFHDAGIVYAPSPYILVILSNMERGAHSLFEEISWFVQDFNHRTFVDPPLLNAPMHGAAAYVSGERQENHLSLTLYSSADYHLSPEVVTVFLPIRTFEENNRTPKFDNTRSPLPKEHNARKSLHRRQTLGIIQQWLANL